MVTDEVLYEQFWDGGKNVADELVHRHGDILVLFLNSYLKDIHEAEDLMIEMFAVCPAKLDHTCRCKSGHGNRQ